MNNLVSLYNEIMVELDFAVGHINDLSEIKAETYKDQDGHKHVIFVSDSISQRKDRNSEFRMFLRHVYTSTYLEGNICRERSRLSRERLSKLSESNTELGVVSIVTIASVIYNNVNVSDMYKFSYIMAWLYGSIK